MEEDQKISDYISELINVVNQTKACSETIYERQIVEKIMRNLSPRFDFIVIAIQESKDAKIRKIEELQAQSINKDSYDKKKFKKGKDNSKGGNWSNFKEKKKK